MNRTRIGLALALSLVVGSSIMGTVASAQDGTPVGEAVDPALCTVEPRTVDELVVIFMEGDYELDEEIAAGNFPQGDPADAETLAAINETGRQLIACSNAGNYRAVMALLTDDGVQFLGPEESDATADDIRQFFADTPVEPVPEDEREVFLPFTGATVLDDGRVGAVLAPTSSDAEATYLIFTEADGQYLIDSVTELSDYGATPEATPSS